ncbi:MAG: YnbE family lipoprotein [Sphingopyxis sp.]|nr:YnbE family lipoprotein [Sphingopyxis sp.]
MLPFAAAVLGGCVQVNAPDKPIEIVLTINIRQEIVYRLDGETRELIEQNSEIF